MQSDPRASTTAAFDEVCVIGMSAAEPLRRADLARGPSQLEIARQVG
jgi:hypothetical protein